MDILGRPGVADAELGGIRERIEAFGLRTHPLRGERDGSGLEPEAPLAFAAVAGRLLSAPAQRAREAA